MPNCILARIQNSPMNLCLQFHYQIKYHIQLWEGSWENHPAMANLLGLHMWVIHIRFPLPSSWLKLMFRIQKLCFAGVSYTPVCRCTSYTWHGQNSAPGSPYRTF